MRPFLAAAIVSLLLGSGLARAQGCEPGERCYFGTPSRAASAYYSDGGYERFAPAPRAPLWILTIDPRTGQLRGIPIPLEELEPRVMPRTAPSYEYGNGNGAYRRPPARTPVYIPLTDRPVPRFRVRASVDG